METTNSRLDMSCIDIDDFVRIYFPDNVIPEPAEIDLFDGDSLSDIQDTFIAHASSAADSNVMTDVSTVLNQSSFNSFSALQQLSKTIPNKLPEAQIGKKSNRLLKDTKVDNCSPDSVLRSLIETETLDENDEPNNKETLGMVKLVGSRSSSTKCFSITSNSSLNNNISRLRELSNNNADILPKVALNKTISQPNRANVIEISDLGKFKDSALIQQQSVSKEILTLNEELERRKDEMRHLLHINHCLHITKQKYDECFKIYLKEYEYLTSCDFSEIKISSDRSCNADKLDKMSSLCNKMMENMDTVLESLSTRYRETCPNDVKTSIFEKKSTDTLSSNLKIENIFNHCNKQQFLNNTTSFISNEHASGVTPRVVRRKLQFDQVIKDSQTTKLSDSDGSKHVFAQPKPVIKRKSAFLVGFNLRVNDVKSNSNAQHSAADILGKEKMNSNQNQLLKTKQLLDDDKNKDNGSNDDDLHQNAKRRKIEEK